MTDERVPAYLGRILDDNHDPVGTCFQFAPGVLVTACHVLAEIGAATEEHQVQVDPLAGGPSFDATVVRVDALRDLAVLTTETHLRATAGPLTPTDSIPLRTEVSATGHAVLDDPEGTYRHWTAPGSWAGGTTRDDAVPLGRMTSTDVAPGMSGAPVIRDRDGVVAGVISARYNSSDGWQTGTIWVARTEDLLPMLDGLAEVRVAQPPLAGPVDLLLTITDDEVRLVGSGANARAQHGGVRPGLAEAVNEIRRSRSRTSLQTRTQVEAEISAGQGSLTRVSKLLGESFLPPPVHGELRRILGAATREHQPVRLGLAVPPDLAGLPWEALPSPTDGSPLALHPLVSLYRKAETGPARVLPGPLRIVVAISSPDTGGGDLLDYERELRNVLAAVRAARQDAADVRVVPFASTDAIRAELDRGPAHVLHISAHGSPGQLYLENEDGSARPVTAKEFAEQAIPPGRMPPVVTLSACYTDAAASEDGASFAAELCQRGAVAVIATETSITDTYATRLLARIYGPLTQSATPDVIDALAQARRQVQAELEISPDPRDNLLAGLAEWAAVTILAASGSVPVLDPDHTAPAAARPPRPHIAGLAERDEWYFVGRRREQRHWPAELTGGQIAGIVIHGIGGTGKTTLAAELTTRILTHDPTRILVSLTASLNLESLLGAVISTVRRELLVRGGRDTAAIQALDVAARADLPWADRFAVLRDHVLDHIPILALLDNFEDNLHPDGPSRSVRDEALAGLLAAWVAAPGRSRLLITSRHPFTLPDTTEQHLSFRQLGALSRAETMKLAWSLPALDTLDESQLDQVWRLAGGHPRSLEYLDALLSGGTARYPDVTTRLNAAITNRLTEGDRHQWLTAHTGLDAALAETIALAADDVLLDDLLSQLSAVPGAPELLLGVSVYREPVDQSAILFQIGQHDPGSEHVPDWHRINEILDTAGIVPVDSLDLASVPDDVRAQLAPHLAQLNQPPTPPYRPGSQLRRQIAACQAASLLTVSAYRQDASFFVHRWTATELTNRLSDSQLAEAHRRAAAYWQWRAQVWPQVRAESMHDRLEARYHLLQAGDADAVGQITDGIYLQLVPLGAWDQAARLIHDTLSRLPPDSPRQSAYIHELGNLAYMCGDYDEAQRLFQRSLDISERLDAQAGMASSYHQLGVIAQRRGDYDEAQRLLQRSLDINERLDNQAGMADDYQGLGSFAYVRGDYDEARRLYQHSLDINERLDNQARIADGYQHLGLLAIARTDYDEAQRQYERSLSIEKRLGDQVRMAGSYHHLGVIAQRRGDYDEARRLYQLSLGIQERLGDQAGMAAGYNQLGKLAYLSGDHDEAQRLYQRSLQISERLGNKVEMATVFSNLGILEIKRGGPVYAIISWHSKALAIRRQLELPEGINDLNNLSVYRRKLGTGPFANLLTQAADNAELVEAIISWLDELDPLEEGTA